MKIPLKSAIDWWQLYFLGNNIFWQASLAKHKHTQCMEKLISPAFLHHETSPLSLKLTRTNHAWD